MHKACTMLIVLHGLESISTSEFLFGCGASDAFHRTDNGSHGSENYYSPYAAS